ncbi:hypothetical protein PT974_00332 [Cladobotryum mycophilum]|uniref:Uncharacterized protein n=1 Tax=Cladobotryum mycophilum TaxID=491253 RepID=A0ABR0T0K4_9HYPO
MRRMVSHLATIYRSFQKGPDRPVQPLTSALERLKLQCWIANFRKTQILANKATAIGHQRKRGYDEDGNPMEDDGQSGRQAKSHDGEEEDYDETDQGEDADEQYDEESDYSDHRPLYLELHDIGRFEIAQRAPNKLIELPIPHIHLNREARQIGLKFANEHNLSPVFCQETQSHVFTRIYMPNKDVVYVPYTRWVQAKGELFRVALSWMDPSIGRFTPELETVTEVAVPEALARVVPEFLGECLSFTRFNLIYVVFDTPPELDLKDVELDLQISRPWELREITEGEDVRVRQYDSHGHIRNQMQEGYYTMDGKYHD